MNVWKRLNGFLCLIGICGALFSASQVKADEGVVLDTTAALKKAFDDAANLTRSGKYIDAATVYFNVYTAGSKYQNIALAMVAESLIKAGLPNTASYFFIKTLQTGDRTSIRRMVNFLPQMMNSVGGDLLKTYILRHTTDGDYNAKTKTLFYYFLGREQLLKDEPFKALQSFAKVGSGEGVYLQTLYMRGVAAAMLEQNQNALNAFRSCAKNAGKMAGNFTAAGREAADLEARCKASEARTYYQMGEHDKAEEKYDEIQKTSFVWTDILFEQAWNSYAKGDYNRSLGKLVTYRSPSLKFVFNPESDVLRAQSFLALCHYDEVEGTVNDFMNRYSSVGGRMKDFLLTNDQNLSSFYDLARTTFFRKLHTEDMLSKSLNRFIRGPYFATLVHQQRMAEAERSRVLALLSNADHKRFGEFLSKVVDWRVHSIKLLGGTFVKNSMLDLYHDLISDLDKMSFIKLEMLKTAKNHLEKKATMTEDESGPKKGRSSVDRRDYQYFWDFNGEFWIDELGDYVFALESQCAG